MKTKFEQLLTVTLFLMLLVFTVMMNFQFEKDTNASAIGTSNAGMALVSRDVHCCLAK
ncbi:MAG: hypothetical protein HQK50_09080 [Oligoflexia bacterium]|nr:hypothetical protein [Oligoflexia bacterium]MBF0365712.1 hypothetical protein [Oligoflexia bacterium]